MAIQTYSEAMKRGVFPHEGGYTNHPSDPGGPTNWGITIIDARLYWKKDATALDVKNMPKNVAEDIYRKQYADVLRYNALPAGVDYSVLDYGINSGVGRSGKVLRRVVGLPDNTSKITDEVIAEVLKRSPTQLIIAINDERLRFLRSLKTWPVFGKGWERRVREVKDLSLNFAKQPVVPIVLEMPAPGKGAVSAPPPAVKDVVIKGGAPSAAVTGGLTQWIGEHPVMTAAVIGGTVVVVGTAAYLAHRQYKARQEAPTPGTMVIPVAA